MTDPVMLSVVIEDETIAVTAPTTPAVNVTAINAPLTTVTIEGPAGPIGPLGPPGPQGPQGPQGPEGEIVGTFEGTAWWYGSGAPTTVVGSKPGDYYMDILTGEIYKLGD